MNRTAHSDAPDPYPVTYAAYFGGISAALSRDGFSLIRKGLEKRLGERVSPERIHRVRIVAEKHGPFYHPARVETLVDGRAVSFVMNVALSEAGKRLVGRECDLLRTLCRGCGRGFLPQVVDRSETVIPVGGGKRVRVPMFLAEWLDGFHEFHLCEGPSGPPPRIRVWDPSSPHLFLTRGQCVSLYREAAKVLTYFYNPLTFEQIFPWHHASGDFVIRVHNGGLELRLVTVRQFASMVGDPDGSPETQGEAALFFLLNMSMRMRLDRLDGTGPTVWSGDEAVGAAMGGFFDGLHLRVLEEAGGSGLVKALHACMVQTEEQGWLERGRALLDACHPLAPDLPVLRSHLEAHTRALYRAIPVRCPVQ